MVILQQTPIPLDTGLTLNVHKTVRRRPGLVRNTLCAFNLRTVSNRMYSTNSSNHVLLSEQNSCLEVVIENDEKVTLLTSNNNLPTGYDLHFLFGCGG